ncbi:MAG TPA: VWA domain-containing protein [Candidatus Hydrogenedentes bacterium]|nr:VWA domain-containing protein [Candidatus Hydrogenedentota bacterium]HOJ67490.1 VWA domain-containing protein [Candidatus Hydrogenedentota bacterium]HOK89638.1 VWA domain-containing protein [Candidatus Hydrogenedentota bacterium]
MTSLLHWFSVEAFTYPGMLWLALPVLALLIWELMDGRAIGLKFSAVTTAAEAAIRPARGRWLPPVGRALGLLCMVIALAGPQADRHLSRDRANVVDIMLCLDVSGSMRQPDFIYQGRPVPRLAIAKEAIRQFIEDRRKQSGERFGVDRIGLVLFSGVAWTACPLTLDYDILLREVENATYAPQNKQGTAIGSALGLAAQRLSKSEARSKVIILLSDGNNNRGQISPLAAAKVAGEMGIRVYPIGAGSPDRVVMSQGLVPVQNEAIDESLLRKIAGTTGGKYFLATDTDTLLQAYAEISQLETTEVEISDIYDYRENAAPYIMLGLLCALLAIAARRFMLEAIP